ncbi:unnamed protein product [Acanthoscelides obtectus]|uniref:DDE Tnp4 domain-containing protein n=1 Tax=Acanthoscelides obtectus TaxID=200917 RepID=A0A9P0MGN0_ACAOB|nr:unnamed protein product [Acanthoscelides obtectus]CAK1624295.1 Putative nuclease HARBI1 [Acanthoscelides obtectus]
MKWNRASAVLLGDSGYGIAPWLMTPFKIAETAEKISYNRLFTRERVIIERCFGHLKQRFPILHNKIRVDTEKVPSLVMSCFNLHNVAKHLNDEDVAVDILGDGEQEEIHNQHAADYADGVIRQREGSLLGPAFIVVALSTGPELPDASSVIVFSSAQAVGV